ncbi:PepSY-associated TM helix domain-containing protein [Kocuria rosea]|uniref:PepSY domain-containing protein n=1 Tax=Kocuria rosea TaxID=1275 RepID=A0A4V3B307_KOCRO|nr:PepSY-associated TM helix domain-containing protein [Kocuria rosea]TDL42839.1 PepSY domain-containing protein [Kocuria rosea]
MSAPTTSHPASQSPPPTSTPPSSRGWGTALLLRLHFYIGVFVGPFLLVAALSGAAYALSPQLERIVYAQALTGTTPETPLSLDAQVAAAQAATGLEVAPAAVRPADDGGTTRVIFADSALGESEHRAVFVDPGTGDVVGDLTVYGSSGSLPVRTAIAQIHRSLLLGEPGRIYSELAASWLGVIALSGLGLWGFRWRRARPGRRARGLLVPDAKAPHRYRRILSFHAATGVWLAVGCLFLSATGLTWSPYAGANVTDLRATMGWTTPVLGKSLDPAQAPASGVEHTGHGDHDHAAMLEAAFSGGSFDAVLAAARDAGIDASLVEIKPTAEPATAWSVAEIDRSWPTQVDTVAVDAATDTVTDQVRFADYGIMAKLAQWGVAAHMGVLFGVVNQVLLAVTALGLAAMVVWGYLMWWRRRPTRAAGLAFGAAPARGNLRRVPWPGLIGIAGVTVTLGVFFPLLGISLAAFLALDLILGAMTARRSRPSAS